jgi:hypothetical protein
MSKQIDYQVKFTETIQIEEYTNEQDAIDQANAQMELLYPVSEGNDYQLINVSDV